MATIFIFDLITTIDKNTYVIYNIFHNQGVNSMACFLCIIEKIKFFVETILRILGNVFNLNVIISSMIALIMLYFAFKNRKIIISYCEKINILIIVKKIFRFIHKYYIMSFIILFILSAISFSLIYFGHSKKIANRFDNALKNYEDTMKNIITNIVIINETNKYISTNSFQQNIDNTINNKIVINNNSQNNTVEYLKMSFEVSFDILKNSITVIMKDSNDILQFWFAFLSVIMIVFTIIGFFLNNNILENAKKQLEMVEKEARTSRENIEKETNKLIEENNKNINITNLFNMSNQADDNRNYNLSINYLTEIIKIYEDDFNNKKYDEKSDNYDKAEKNCAVAYNNRGNAKSDLAKAKGKNNEEYDKLLNDAVEDYNKAIKLYSKNSIAFYTYYNRGNAKRLLLKIEEAIEDYSKAIEFNPNFEGAYFNRGISKSDLSILIKKDNKIEEYNKLVNEAYNDFKTACSLANSELKKELINRIIVLAQNNDEVAIKFCEEHNINYNDNKE